MVVSTRAAEFAANTGFTDVPQRVKDLAKRSILDCIGVALAGLHDRASYIVREYLRELEGRPEASIWGTPLRLPTPLAALANGVSSHIFDYDDTQLSTSKEAVFGLLTHPTSPVLSAALPVAEAMGLSGHELLTAFCVATEVECRVADAIDPRHYREGFHSTGTAGTIGACVAVGKLLGLSVDEMVCAIGIATSEASGLGVNFGTMTKSFHVGKAAQNGVLAACLAQRGFTAAKNALEGPRGFFQAMGGGFSKEKLVDMLGKPYFFESPGVAIKPHPCGSLAHPAMSIMLNLLKEHDFGAEDVSSIEVGTNSLVPRALLYSEPRNALEAKFSMHFCMAVLVVDRRAGLAQFTDEKVGDPRIRELMKKVKLYVHPEIEKLGYDRMRTKVDVKLKDGKTLSATGDVAKGHPENPMSDEELAEKFRDCARTTISDSKMSEIIDSLLRLEKVDDVRDVASLLRPLPITG